MISMTTTMGAIDIEMDFDKAPKSADNFEQYVNDGHFDDMIFHRVIDNFMIQGGDPESKNAAAGAALGSGGPGYTLEAEIMPGLYHKKGALSAARQGDQVNPEKRYSGSQFYIVVSEAGTASLTRN